MSLKKTSKILLVLITIYLGVSQAKPYDDTLEYSNFLIYCKKLSFDQQLQLHQEYLKKRPESLYSEDIRNNIKALQSVSSQTQSKNKQNEDTELFFKAQSMSKTLNLEQQLRLWQQFIKENPGSIYISDAQYQLKQIQNSISAQKMALEQQKQKDLMKNPNKQIDPTQSKEPVTIAEPPLPKDRKRALMLASSAGLVVPGIGHWYSKDYVPASIFTAMRATGIGLFIYGFYDNSRSTQVTGSLLAIASYVADVADAPFSVDRYNRSFINNENSSGAFIEKQPYQFSISLKLNF